MLKKVKIKAINRKEIKSTIDITTDGNHLFFANGILTHNSGWDTSDVSMANVSESAGIAHTADYMGCLWQEEGDRENCKINNTTLKNRFGMVGHNGEFRINYENLRVRDMETEMSVDSDIIHNITQELGDL